MEPTAITHEKKGKWSEPNLHEDMCKILIFRGVTGMILQAESPKTHFPKLGPNKNPERLRWFLFVALSNRIDPMGNS